MRTPLDLSRDPPPMIPAMVEMYPWAVRNALIKIHEEVRGIRAEAATRMKHFYDRTASLAPFAPGDKVFLYNKAMKKNESSKLHINWTGPYKVVTIINDCDARIQNIAKPQDIQIVHMDRLAPFPKPGDDVGAWLNYSGTQDSDSHLNWTSNAAKLSKVTALRK